MNIRRLFSLLFVTVMVLGMTGPATAAAPQPVGSEWCNIWWWYERGGEWFPYVIEGEGQLVHNPNHEIYNLSCSAVIDFSGDFTWDDFCAFYPGTCKQDKMVINHLEVWHETGPDEGYSGFATLNATRNGVASWNAQFSPWTCDRGFISNNITLELPEGYWSVGEHSYEVVGHFLDGTETIWPVNFDVSQDAPLYKGHVRLGLYGPSHFFWQVDAVNPAQETFIQGTTWAPYQRQEWLFDYGIITIDNGAPITIDAGTTKNMCSNQHISWYLRTWGPKY